MYPVEADNKAICSHEHIILITKQFHVSTGCYINKTFIFYTIHQRKIHEQSIFPRSFILFFDSRIDSVYLTDRGKLVRSKHALNNTEFIP